MRRVVHRGVPSSSEEQIQPAVSASVSKPGLSKAGAAADKDDISMGLTSLMGRSRTKEHRPRTRTQDRKEEVKEEAQQEDEKGKVEEERQEEALSMPAPVAPNPTPPKSNPFTPPVGFIPPPKPDPLAPPAGFIPVPKQNLLTPPPGFVPASKTSPVLPKHNPLARPPGFVPVPKTDPLAPPAGFIPKPRSFAVKKPEVAHENSACLTLCYCVS